MSRKRARLVVKIDPSIRFLEYRFLRKSCNRERKMMMGWRWGRREMARIEWGFQGRGKWCSYKRTTLIICSINIAVALYVLHSLYNSIYISSNIDSQSGKALIQTWLIPECSAFFFFLSCSWIVGKSTWHLGFLWKPNYDLFSFYRVQWLLIVSLYSAVKYTPDQIRKMEESIRIRRASEPVELVKLVNPHSHGCFLGFY